MIQQVSIYDFRDRFLSSDTYKGNFTYEGLNALYNYLEELEESTGEPIEFDMIGLCCEYSEYENIEELQANYSDIKSMEELEDKTQVIKIEDSEGFIIQDF